MTKHPETARFIKSFFRTVELRFATGEREVALVTPGGNKRWHSGSKAHVHPLAKRRALEKAENIDLDVALGAQAYGRLVSFDEYKLHDNKDSFWHLPFLNNGERLAVMFQEMVIQSGDDILLALKVEVYGTDIEDPHAQELVRPTGKNAFKVEKVYHDQTHKVMVGGVKWCVLVTFAVMLTDGTVIVGPDNKHFNPRASSSIWLKKDPNHGLYNTMGRQLRSKYNKEETFGPYAAVHPLLNHYTTMPVTLATLFNYKSNRAWSGSKLASFVFYQLCSRRRIVKAELETHVKEVIDRGISCQNLEIVKRMIEVMADEEAFPVSDPVNKCLTELAGKLSGEITSINNKEVMNAVGKKIKTMIESEDA
ncbi:hypothetical protein BGZ94_002754 [Podila epigama]|nr:hypothetical protein BGZ94_002754 [Podila epigama]